jgi:GDP-L-fucose synthase
VTEFPGKLIFDDSKPDGTPRKLLNVDKINALGWKAEIELEAGLRSTYADFQTNYSHYITKKHAH